MRQPSFLRLAIWLIEHSATPPYGRAIAGDLLEERSHGQSTLWFTRQVFSAIASALRRRAQPYALPLAFCIAWSLLYPAWATSLWSNPLLQHWFGRWAVVDWPVSALFAIADGLLPALSLTWCGLLAFTFLRHPGARPQSALHLLAGLSLSLSVLLASLGALGWSATPGPAVTLARHLSDLSLVRLASSVPVALSLLAGLLVAGPARSFSVASPLAP